MTDRASAFCVPRLDTQTVGFDAGFDALIQQQLDWDQDVVVRVSEIIAAVRSRGDAAVLEFTAAFDDVTVDDIADLTHTPDDFRRAFESLESPSQQALQAAAHRIREYHEQHRLESWHYADDHGTRLGQEVRPLDRVGVYAPGGKAAYPSSVLMGVIPAHVAGVEDIVMMVPAPGGAPNPVVLAAAHVAGVTRVFSIGGAQAIAALAYGTETIPAVDKIVGPGNVYVATAKRMVFGAVGIDMIAGPSEILVICDGASRADWIAMDLFSQAEHDEDARAILISPDGAFLDDVEQAMQSALPSMERQRIIEHSLAANGALIKVRDLDEAIELSNRVAPEHLELSVAQPEQWLPKVRHAGAVFLGRHTAEALGDYCAGPNHVLPTARTARFSSPLGVYDFQKRSSVIQCSPEGASELGRVASVLARSEQLTAHARSAEYRIIDE